MSPRKADALSRLDFHSLFAGVAFAVHDSGSRSALRRNERCVSGHHQTYARRADPDVTSSRRFPREPERLALFRDAFERALRGEANELVKTLFRVPKPAEEGGGFRDIYWTCSHLRCAARTAISFMIQHAQDVTEQVRAEKLNEVMARELEHRVRNILSVVTSIGRLAGRSASNSRSSCKASTHVCRRWPGLFAPRRRAVVRYGPADVDRERTGAVRRACRHWSRLGSSDRSQSGPRRRSRWRTNSRRNAAKVRSARPSRRTA